VTILSDGSHAFSDNFAFEAEGVSTFVFPRAWLLEVNRVDSGRYGYMSDGREVFARSGRFAAFYPQFAVISPVIKRAKGTCSGIASTTVFPWLPDAAVIFETDFDREFTSAADVEQLLTSGRALQRIDVNTAPTRLAADGKRMIDDNFLIYPSIAKIAGRLGVSPEHLSREFKRNYTVTPSSYLHQLRVAEATSRLAAGEPIVEIAMDVGYNDLSRFYKQFRKKTQTSPGECRETLKVR